MSQCGENFDEIYSLTKFFNCKEIKLYAFSRIGNEEVLVIFTGNVDFIYHNMDLEDPIIRQIFWFEDSVHDPISICFSPDGCFLLVLSKGCHLYILPTPSVFKEKIPRGEVYSTADLTIHTYPFSSENTCRGSFNVPLPHKNNAYKFGGNSESLLNDKQLKLKEMLGIKCEFVPSAVCWWQSLTNLQEVAIIGTKSGEILFVDLATGFKIGETSIIEGIKNLSICQDKVNESSFLLITADNFEQYKLTLEPKFKAPSLQSLQVTESRDSAEMTNAEQIPAETVLSRTRLQGFRQKSADQIASLKHKISKCRVKISSKQESEYFVKRKGIEAENVGLIVGEKTVLFPQMCHDGYILAGYYETSQLLTVYSSDLSAPVSMHKMPPEIVDVMLCNRIICAVTEGRRTVQMISSKLTETQIERYGDFDYSAVVGKWSFGGKNAAESKKMDPAQPELAIKSAEGSEECEMILNICKSSSKPQDLDSQYSVQIPKDFMDFPVTENCIVVTNRSLYVIHLKSDIMKIALYLILETHELEKAERLCNIFGINLKKLLELAGDIKLNASEFPTAIALYKLSKCGLLKSIVKLACRGYCAQVLNYSLMLMSTSISEMPTTEKVHLSNLIIMAYTQQILKTENNRKLQEKFIDFLRSNCFFDEVLAVSVIGQSLLFSCLHELIVRNGLIVDGYKVIVKLMERFSTGRTLRWTLNENSFWDCASETALIEAALIKPSFFSTFATFVSNNLSLLSLVHLEKFSKMFDPTASCLSPLANIFYRSSDSSPCDNDGTSSILSFGELVELFVLTVLAKERKNRNVRNYYRRKYLHFLVPPPSAPSVSSPNSGLSTDRSGETSLVKQLNNSNLKKCRKVLSCGFGHAALVRNNVVFTWGQTAQGCLGRGPTMMRYSSPAPLSWFKCLRIEVLLVACGKSHTAALTSNGIYTWGCSKYGQLGLGKIEKCPHPRLVSALADELIVSVSCGQFHTIAITENGSVFAWGWGVHGQLGLGTTDDHRVPRRVESLKNHVIVDVAGGHGHTLALSDTGHVYSFGSGVFGQLGTGTTAKYSLPVIVKGFKGKITAIATGYFHNLALTEFNTLYTWGCSPQSLRIQAQALKKSKLAQTQVVGKSPTNYSSISPLKLEPNGENGTSEEKKSDLHLSPSLVDTSNVEGKIVEITCGCHHSALLTESGGLFTWGRSLDGQLGCGNHREATIPTQIGGKKFEVDHVSCGCEFTAAVEKHTGKVYAWGSNSVGQLALPVKESATRTLDGKFVMLKSCKRVVRILDRNSGSNSSNVPSEIMEIPPPGFADCNVSQHIVRITEKLSLMDPDYSDESLHFAVESFGESVNLNRLFDKSIHYENFQLASKIALLQNEAKRAMVCQLKALQSLRNYQSPMSSRSQKNEALSPLTSKGIELEISPSLNPLDLGLEEEYHDHALYIMKFYLELNLPGSEENREMEKCAIIETGIQFWKAEKLPMLSLEHFFSDRSRQTLYYVAYVLFCCQNDRAPFFHRFSTEFLLMLTRELSTLVKTNEECFEYVEVMSNLLRDRRCERPAKTPTDINSRPVFEKKKFKWKSNLESIADNLCDSRNDWTYLKIYNNDF